MVTQYLREFSLQWKPAIGLNGEPVPAPFGARVDTAADAARLVRPLIGDSYREVGVLLALSTSATVVGVHILAIGTLERFPVRQAEVMRAALMANASSFVVAHNHPSGDLTPSADDLDLARALARAGQAMDLPLVDSIIIGPDSPEVVSLHRRYPALWARIESPRLTPASAAALARASQAQR